jgi:hypothetical protein
MCSDCVASLDVDGTCTQSESDFFSTLLAKIFRPCPPTPVALTIDNFMHKSFSLAGAALLYVLLKLHSSGMTTFLFYKRPGHDWLNHIPFEVLHLFCSYRVL